MSEKKNVEIDDVNKEEEIAELQTSDRFLSENEMNKKPKCLAFMTAKQHEKN